MYINYKTKWPKQNNNKIINILRGGANKYNIIDNEAIIKILNNSKGKFKKILLK